MIHTVTSWLQAQALRCEYTSVHIPSPAIVGMCFFGHVFVNKSSCLVVSIQHEQHSCTLASEWHGTLFNNIMHLSIRCSLTVLKKALKNFCFFIFSPLSLKRIALASLVLRNVKVQIFAFLERICVMVIMTVEIWVTRALLTVVS